MLRFLGRGIYVALGWRLEGELPKLDKYVIIGAPHTSNWDGAVFIAGVARLGVRLRFLVKQELLRGPLGPIFRYFGAIGVDRSSTHNLVADITAEFERNEHFILALGPEGTRRYQPYWRSGFYHIARAADVPLLLIGIHFREKRIILGPTVRLSGDVRADMDRIRAFYAANSSGREDSRVSPVRLREEVAADAVD